MKKKTVALIVLLLILVFTGLAGYIFMNYLSDLLQFTSIVDLGILLLLAHVGVIAGILTYRRLAKDKPALDYSRMMERRQKLYGDKENSANG